MDAATQTPFLDLFPAFLVGLALGALVVWLWGRGRTTLLGERLARAYAELERADAERERARELELEIATLRAERDADAERLAWIHTADEQLRAHFQALAGEALEASSRQLVERSDERLRHVVAPVETALERLGGQVREIEKERRGAYDGLKQEIQLLRDAHRRLRTSATSLEQALKSSSVRGRWGEVQLRRVVEMAGLLEHVDFTEQPTADAGLRPDMIVKLPRGGVLPVDAKAPMRAYFEAAEAPDDAARRRGLDAHLKALRQRTLELGGRRYWERFERAPDFVVMFLPNEACLGGAFERDPDFLDFALRHRVLPATPVTLLALLKSVSYGWQQHRIAENARHIASSGRELHDRLLTFLDHLRRLGKSLDGASQAYNQAVGSLERRVLPSARRLEEAGAAAGEVAELEPLQTTTRRPAVEDGIERREPLGGTAEIEPPNAVTDDEAEKRAVTATQRPAANRDGTEKREPEAVRADGR